MMAHQGIHGRFSPFVSEETCLEPPSTDGSGSFEALLEKRNNKLWLRLLPPTHAHSTRAFRRYGAKNFLRIGLHRSVGSNEVHRFVKSAICDGVRVHGRHFRPCMFKAMGNFFELLDVDVLSVRNFFATEISQHPANQQQCGSKLAARLELL